MKEALEHLPEGWTGASVAIIGGEMKTIEMMLGLSLLGLASGAMISRNTPITGYVRDE